jgi:predicted SAM-dependent methyltransferase
MASKKLWDILSPDGISIRINVPPFKSQLKAYQYLKQWEQRYSTQGYYSSNEGRIPLYELKSKCKLIALN